MALIELKGTPYSIEYVRIVASRGSVVTKVYSNKYCIAQYNGKLDIEDVMARVEEEIKEKEKAQYGTTEHGITKRPQGPRSRLFKR